MAAKKVRKYGSTAGKKVGKAMRERKHRTLRSGGSGKKVTSRKQAVAIGLSEARRRGAKVPEKKKGSVRTPKPSKSARGSRATARVASA